MKSLQLFPLLLATLAGPVIADTQPLHLLSQIELSFPANLQMQGVSHGNVHCVIQVDATGKLEDLLITTYTHPDFARAVRDAITRWHFEPAMQDGKPMPSQTKLEFNFEAKGVVMSMDLNTTLDRLLGDLGHNYFAYRPSLLREIDRIPLPLVTVKPAYSNTLAAQKVSGHVSVDFYIDETGRVRMPIISGSDDPRLAEAAIVAVQQWKFEPPLRNGSPTLVLARQDFTFTPGS